MKHINVIKYLLGLTLLLSNNLIADTETQDVACGQEVADERYKAAGERFVPVSERLADQERLAAEPTSGVDEADLSAVKISQTEFSSQFGNQKNLSLLSKEILKKNCRAGALVVTTHPGAIHWTTWVSPYGDSIRLEDDSIWIVKLTDSCRALRWLPTDALILTANDDYFSSYQYRIHNQNLGDSVAVNLSLYLIPPCHSVFNHVIVEMDHRRIWLSDGSVWSIYHNDSYRRWCIGDTVIIGVNNGFRSGSRPNILLNAVILQRVRAHCLN